MLWAWPAWMCSSGLQKRPAGPATPWAQSAGPSLLAAQATSLPRPSVLVTRPPPQTLNPARGERPCAFASLAGGPQLQKAEPGAEALGHSPPWCSRAPGLSSGEKALSAISLCSLRLPGCCPTRASVPCAC